MSGECSELGREEKHSADRRLPVLQMASAPNPALMIIGCAFIDKTGRKKLLAIGLLEVTVSLGFSAAVFHACPALSSAHDPGSCDCTKCSKASLPDCSFRSSPTSKLFPGPCWVSNDTTKEPCCGGDRQWDAMCCLSGYGWLALIGLAVHIASSGGD
ncbi:probable inositol transporter 2 [Eucalyptus grandis]|uniref:probable inositol transporter 2 n=1 Tax=Eucalyptus grandis TaxID=71139 RepID=UPI00192EE8F9|nr:probable inositol transporter 2 [Eucalyptus grandis]